MKINKRRVEREEARVNWEETSSTIKGEACQAGRTDNIKSQREKESRTAWGG